MGAHELAFVGLAGSGLGTAVGMPLVWSRSALVPAEWLVGFVVLLNVSHIVRMQLVHDLINRRRVEDVKRQLDVPESERFTIEGIGVSAGFGSRSALYSAFKRYEGMTPTAYRYSSRKASAG